jgi:hypothetical protein
MQRSLGTCVHGRRCSTIARWYLSLLQHASKALDAGLGAASWQLTTATLLTEDASALRLLRAAQRGLETEDWPNKLACFAGAAAGVAAIGASRNNKIP